LIPGHCSRTQGGHTKTSAEPALAVCNNLLYLDYRGSGSDDLWYNVFDGSSWLANDIKITQGGHTKTSRGPALAVYNGLLHLAYRGADSDEMWFNVFDGTNWQAQCSASRQAAFSGTALRIFCGLLCRHLHRNIGHG
jgi:hypothetical protein